MRSQQANCHFWEVRADVSSADDQGPLDHVGAQRFVNSGRISVSRMYRGFNGDVEVLVSKVSAKYNIGHDEILDRLMKFVPAPAEKA